MMKDKQYKCVFSLKIARELLKAGFEVEQVALNREDANYLVFYFEATPALIERFEYIKANVC